MGQIPKWIAAILVVLVVGMTWFFGTREIDFLRPPTPTQIELAKTRASQQLARPSSLFAVPREPTSSPVDLPSLQVRESPQAELPPTIAFGNLTGDPPLDAWFELNDMPAASFIELASRLEAETKMAWARVAWERVIDRSKADQDQLQAALKGVLRTQLVQTGVQGEPLPQLELLVRAPQDRVTVSRRAADEALLVLGKASSGLISLSTTVDPSPELEMELEVAIGRGERISAIRIDAPAAPTDYSEVILNAVFRLIASQLAANPELAPVSPPAPGEKIDQALLTRITRLSWQSLAAAYKGP